MVEPSCGSARGRNPVAATRNIGAVAESKREGSRWREKKEGARDSERGMVWVLIFEIKERIFNIGLMLSRYFNIGLYLTDVGNNI